MLAAAAAGLAAVLAVPAAAMADGAGEFEDGYVDPQTADSYPADATASGGAAARLRGNSTVYLSVHNDTPTTAYRIRARQKQCGPAAAQMTVKVDGVAAGTITVAATAWTDYTVAGNWAADWRLLEITFANPYQGGSCGHREILLDRVTAVSRPTFYVDASAGNDGDDGRSPATAWRTIGHVNAATFAPGDTVLFKRGQTFDNAALVADNPGVTYGSYGDGALPVLDGNGQTYPVEVVANNVTVRDLLVRDGGGDDRIGLAVRGTDTLVQGVTATGNAIGVQAFVGAHRMHVTGSILADNTTVIDPTGGTQDDYGATGVVVLAADHVEIDHNTISGNIGPSQDFVHDGSAVEIYGAIGTTVHHNRAHDNQTFSEVGNPRTEHTTFHNNLITTSASFADNALGINLQGDDSEFGPVTDTTIVNNTIVILSGGPESGGVITGPGADAVLHNNVVHALHGGHTADAIDEAYNVYSGSVYVGIVSQHSTTGGIASTSVKADALFAGPGDYQLQSGSPAKNRGVSNFGVTRDLADQPRTFGPGTDAGAFERQTA